MKALSHRGTNVFAKWVLFLLIKEDGRKAGASRRAVSDSPSLASAMKIDPGDSKEER